MKTRKRILSIVLTIATLLLLSQEYPVQAEAELQLLIQLTKFVAVSS